MIPLLAQATPAPEALASWLEVAMYIVFSAAGVVGLLVGLKQLKTEQPTVPNPLQVQKHDAGVSEDELQQVHGRISRERKEIDDMLKALREEDRTLREKLDDEIKDLHGRIDAVPERTINLLKGTKGLLT